MENPTFLAANKVAPDVTSLISYAPLPGLGLLPVNSFVIHASQPVVVDTGLEALRAPLLAALEQTIDPRDVRWIWLSHIDADHVGNYQEVLARCPNATVVTTYLGVGKLGLRNFDVSRVRMLDAGATIDAGDRTLVPLQALYYDAPETLGFLDTRTRVLFTADAFGAPLEAPRETAGDIVSADLLERMFAWSSLDAPWLGLVDRAAMSRAMAALRRIDPSSILSAHLPVAHGMTTTLLGNLERILDSGHLSAATTQAPYAEAA